MNFYLLPFVQCLEKPHKPKYSGGIIVNPELKHGLKGWSAFGNAKLQHRESQGNEFVVAHSRNEPHDSISQKMYLQRNKLYSFSGTELVTGNYMSCNKVIMHSFQKLIFVLYLFCASVAWIQVSNGSVPVTAVFKTNSGFVYAGSIVAESNCWSMLKGGLTVNSSGPAELYFEVILNTCRQECTSSLLVIIAVRSCVIHFIHLHLCTPQSNIASVDIWVDSISLQPFTEKQWKSHQDQSINKVSLIMSIYLE